jgi:peroxiredoxin
VSRGVAFAECEPSIRLFSLRGHEVNEVPVDTFGAESQALDVTPSLGSSLCVLESRGRKGVGLGASEEFITIVYTK